MLKGAPDKSILTIKCVARFLSLERDGPDRTFDCGVSISMRPPVRDKIKSVQQVLTSDSLTEVDLKISMEGRDRCFDDIFIGRLWRSFKQNIGYLHKLQVGFQAKRVIKDWIEFYNSERRHTALVKRSPDNAVFNTERAQKVAKNQTDYTLAKPLSCPNNWDLFISHIVGAR